jgi:hypothetical protein
MIDVKKIVPVAQTVYKNVKHVFLLIKDRKYWVATKETFNMTKGIYTNHIKGRFISVKGKRIPLAAVLAAIVLFLYIIYPSGEKAVPAPEPVKPSISEVEMLAQMNYYNQDGIIIDKMHKCQDAVCGVLENTSDEEIAEVTIPVAFFNREGILVYEGRIKATNVPSNEPKKFQISAEIPFDFFKLGVVIVVP